MSVALVFEPSLITRRFTAVGLTLLALFVSGCDQQPADNYSTVVAERSDDALSPAGFVMAPGKYVVESSDGELYSETELRSDGTYSRLDTEGKKIASGTWSDRRGKACFDPQGDGPKEQERCWTNSALAKDGTFTTTGVDGTDSYTVRPLKN